MHWLAFGAGKTALIEKPQRNAVFRCCGPTRYKRFLEATFLDATAIIFRPSETCEIG